MSLFLKALAGTIAGIGIAVAGFFAGSAPQATQSDVTVGSFTPVGGQTYVLAGAGISSSATTITLTSFKTPDGRALTMSMFGSIGYGVVDPNSPTKIEDITFTGITQNANGTAVLTGVSRGMDFVSPYLASTSLAQSHAGGAYFILSNTAGFYGQQFLFSDTLGTSTGGLVFSSTTPPHYDFSPSGHNAGTYHSTTTELVDFVALNAVALAGAPNATAGVKGVIQIGTAAQAASSTALGSTGASLAISTATATDTPQRGCNTGFSSTAGAGCSVIADLGGHIKQAWINLTDAFTFTGLLTATAGITSSATTTLTGSNVLSNAIKINTIPYSFPSSQGTASTTWINDGSGNLNSRWPNVAYIQDSATYATSQTATTTPFKTYTIAASSIGINGTLKYSFLVTSSGTNNNKCIRVNIGTGSATTTLGQACDVSTAAGLILSISGTVRNLNSASSQINAFTATGANSILVNGNGGTTGKAESFLVTSAANTAAQFYIDVAGTVINASDSVTLEGFNLELLP